MHTTRKPSRPGRRHARRAFSLVELIVAITIMGILAVVVVPRVIGWIGFAKEKRAAAETETISNAVRMHMSQHGMSSLNPNFDLRELTEGSNPQLTQNQLLDPWGFEYQIRVPGEVNFDFDIYTLGSDGQVGGEGEAADIVAGQKRAN